MLSINRKHLNPRISIPRKSMTYCIPFNPMPFHTDAFLLYYLFTLLLNAVELFESCVSVWIKPKYQLVTLFDMAILAVLYFGSCSFCLSTDVNVQYAFLIHCLFTLMPIYYTTILHYCQNAVEPFEVWIQPKYHLVTLFSDQGRSLWFWVQKPFRIPYAWLNREPI